MRISTTGFIGLLLGILCGCSSKPIVPAPSPPVRTATAQILKCGEIEAKPPSNVKYEPDTQLGFVNVLDPNVNPKFKPGCPQVKGKVGTRFGIHVLAEGAGGLSIIPLTTRVTHPVMINPNNGREVTVDSWASPMNSGIARYTGWKFDNEWELVPGKWTMEILDGETVIAGQEFEVSVDRK